MCDGCLKIDKELISLVEYKLGLSAEEVVENYLKSLIYYDDEESKIIKDFVKTSKKLDKLKIKLIDQIKNADHSYDDKLLEKSLTSLERINERLGYVGRNQISSIAKVNHVKANLLEGICIEKGMKVFDHGEGVK